jgi:site-specific recombinase XerC
LDILERDDLVAALDGYTTYTNRSGIAVTRARSTQLSFYTALRSFLSWCVETEKLVRNPMARIKQPKQPGRAPKAMSEDECRQLLTQAQLSRSPERDTLVVTMALTMGLRLAEMAGGGPWRLSAERRGADASACRRQGRQGAGAAGAAGAAGGA